MLKILRQRVESWRMLRSPAIQRWEQFEQSAGALIVISVIVLLFLKLIGFLNVELIFMSALVGILICSIYYSALATNDSVTMVIVVATVLFATATIALHVTLPLWSLLLNGSVGVNFVIGLVAIWTRYK